MSDYELACEKTDHCVDEAPMVLYGGGGNLGLNRLGQPYATAAIGSGPDLTTPSDNRGIRRGASFTQNFRREREQTDRTYDRLQTRR